MKKRMRTLVGMCAIVLVFMLSPIAVQAASLNVTLGTTDNASAGDTVTARIMLGNNPGISTFAVKLAYDSNYLTYTGASWAEAVVSDSNNVQLISEVTENGGPVLNISTIFNSTYSNNETIVTLNFTAKQGYTTMPVTLSNREITDSSYNPVTVSLLVDAQAGQTDTQNSESPSESQSESQGGSESQNQGGSESESTGNSQGNQGGSESESTGNSQGGSSSQSGGGSSQGSSGNSSSDKKNLDKTPKTGAVDIRLVLGAAIVLFLVVAGVCIKVLGKKRTR